MDIDFVYLWVDGNDPEWQKKRNAFIGRKDEDSSRNCKGRYVDNDELKYSLRSIEKYAPWIRKVFIITDNQIPEWLDTSNPRVKIVDHAEILPPESRPCFNSSVIEAAIYKIPKLSEHFLYACDDMFLNRPVTPDNFYTPDGLPFIRMTRMPFRRLRWYWREHVRKHPLKNYSITVAHSSEMVNEKYGHYYNGLQHHNIDAYRKSDLKYFIEDVFRDEFRATAKNRMRTDNDVPRNVISYAALAEKRGKLRYVTKRESMMVMIHRERHFRRMEKYHPIFFCLNDSEHAADNDRIRAREFMQKRFPDKSSFEK